MLANAAECVRSVGGINEANNGDVMRNPGGI